MNSTTHKFITQTIFFIFAIVITPFAGAVDLNVLVIGSSRSYSSEQYSSIARNQNAFNPQLIVNELQNILDADNSYTNVTVRFEDISANTITRSLSNPTVANATSRSYSLLNYYYWPDDRTNRLANLKGTGTGTDDKAWDHVIILGDPSYITNTPGVYALGVKLLIDTIKQGTAEPLLMMQWPHSGSSVPVADFGEVTYRVGDSGGIPVAPAGFTWDAYTSKDSGTHPTPDGAYLAAATIYNKMLGKDAASDSTHTYKDASTTNTLAALANTTVLTHNTASHYSGAFDQAPPHKRLDDKDRVIQADYGAGSSTEQTFLSWGQYNSDRYFNALLQPELSLQQYSDAPSEFSGLKHLHIGRNNPSSDSKRYRAWPATYRTAYAFSFQIRNQDVSGGDGGLQMLYGIDYISGSYRGDQRTSFDLISLDHVSKGVRILPIHMLWAAAKDELGITTPFSDGTHYGADVNEAAVSYMMTNLTGRCPIGKNGTATERTRQRIGYETSWVMSSLNLRPPGFTTQPSAYNAKTVTPGTSETMSVYFINPPESEVTVSVAPSANTAAIVNPKTLTFDASNHDTIQNVKVTGLPGSSSAESFNVTFTSSSSDMCFADLSDSWKYTNNRSSTESITITEQSTRQDSVPKNGAKTIDLQVTGSLESNTIFAAPHHGTLTWSGSGVIYTPDADFVGNDSFAFAVNVGGEITKGYIEITVEELPVSVTYNGNGSNGGSAPTDSNSYSVNATVTVQGPGSLTRSGYTFSHWATAANGSGSEYSPSGTFQITQNTTLYAQWSLADTIDYFEDFTNAGQPTHPSGTGWVMYNAINPAQATWEDFIPGDGKAYITVTAASHDDDRAYQMFNAGALVPGQRFEIRAKNMAVPGYTAFLFTYTDADWDEIDFDEIDIEIVASDDQGTDPGHPIGPNGGWTDARFNAWCNADAPSYTPWKGTSKPVEDENGQPVSHMDGEWHTYTIEWINDGGLENGPNGRCLFYIDGVLQYTIDDMSPDSMADVLIGYRDLSWAGPDNPIGWTGEHTMELDWYRVTPIDYQSPNANFDTYTVENGENVINQSVLANDAGSGLTAVLLSQPEHGTITLNQDGTFTYTADAEYSGRDHFVYYATDGTPKGTSNTCVVELIINKPPVADAGINQTVYMNGSQSWNPSAISTVAWYDANDASTITKDGSNKVSQWNDKSGNSRHATQTNTSRQPTYTATDSMLGSMPSIGNIGTSGQIGLTTPSMTAKNVYVVTYYKDGLDNSFDGHSTLFSGSQDTWGKYRVMGWLDKADLYNTSHFNDSGTYKNGSTTSSLTTVLPLPASIFTFKSNAARTQIYGLGFNQGQNDRDWQGSYCEWVFTDGTEYLATQQKIDGYLAHKWGLADSLPSAHPYKNYAPSAASATATLDGTASDPDGNALTYTWSDTGTGNGTGEVTFANASAIDTTASFSQPGTYVLQLTANDGYTVTSDQVTITVNPADSNTFTNWISGYSVGGLTGIGDDPDGDGITNGIENYFGTDPSSPTNGIQIASVTRGANTTLTFSHPLNGNPAADITAAYIWTKDLSNYYADGATDGSTTVSFSQGTPSDGMVTVTATITGTANKVFVAVQVTQE